MRKDLDPEQMDGKRMLGKARTARGGGQSTVML